MKKALLFVFILLPLIFAFKGAEEPTSTCTTCNALTNLTNTGQTTSSLTYQWTASANATAYRIVCEKTDGETQYFNTTNTNIVISGLTPGDYTLSFYTVCGSQISSFIVITDNSVG